MAIETQRVPVISSPKDQPDTPAQLIGQLDERLEALQTDYVDLIVLHALGDRNFEVEIQSPTSQEFYEARA